MTFSPLTQELIEALRCLPGVGPRSAQRMAWYLLDRQRQGGKHLGNVLLRALEHIGRCEQCQMWSEMPLCGLCSAQNRDSSRLCVVVNPADVVALEEAHAHRGHYFVLAGCLSPIDGRGPEEIGIIRLINRLKTSMIKELILAINPTVEGEATTYYISEVAKKLEIPVFRIAYGVPMGGELEFVDGGTLKKAMLDLKPL